MKAKIVLVHFPFTDLTDSKLRPALVIHESRNDVIAAFISSRIPLESLHSNLRISSDHPEFPVTGLKVTSFIRFDKVATVSKELIEGEIGEIPKDLIQDCNEVMNEIFRL
jgi:mRNA interferase MazF